ncbi:hypothetical protein M885DRAFT_621144 [Pelagophyceae sp. CCMP2097]|nr:hypothetical protein M885DRAFT_621144 [Pelagophyceae sp. CCMP2097]
MRRALLIAALSLAPLGCLGFVAPGPSPALHPRRSPPLHAADDGGKKKRVRKNAAPEVAKVVSDAVIEATTTSSRSSPSKSDSNEGIEILRPPLMSELRISKLAPLDTANFPVPSEVRGGGGQSDAAKAKKEGIALGDGLRLPDLQELSRKSDARAEVREERGDTQKILRGDMELLRRALESDPNADVNPDLYLQGTTARDRVDIVANILGENAQKFFAIESAYIQLGHTVLPGVLLLMANVHEPGLPLTDLPQAYRDFFIQGLEVTYAINVFAGAKAFFEAKDREQPQIFWAAKTLLLGGVSLNQLRTGTKTAADLRKKLAKKNKPFPERRSNMK